ncbi:uncharacterized protein LOC115752739 [Rhodamnia argentea]|uniref:Uncharacterized protein LOC115752739 n=1 Tax=Rhodamnia argentea TaxID=178133 RepID=A0A8B8QIC1_9MYRT|nr:uncharacterized protein LOC115752739 [Rhodamnia argentea]
MFPIPVRLTRLAAVLTRIIFQEGFGSSEQVEVALGLDHFQPWEWRAVEMERPEARRDHVLKQMCVDANVIAHVPVERRIEFADVTTEAGAKDCKVTESAVALPPCKLKVESLWRVIRVFQLDGEFRTRLVEVRVAGFAGVGGGGCGLNGVGAAIAVDFRQPLGGHGGLEGVCGCNVLSDSAPPPSVFGWRLGFGF